MTPKFYAVLLFLFFAVTACKPGTDTDQPVCALSDNPYFFYGAGSYLLVPNAFTPNGDGRNDLFRPVFNSGGQISNYRIEIKDKNGAVIYANTDTAAAGWDGRNGAGDVMPPGRYSASMTYSAWGGTTSYNFCVALLSYGGGQCIPRSADGEYVFQDMYDSNSNYFSLQTGERICN